VENDVAETEELTPQEIAGGQLRLLRQGRGWSQQEVADRMRNMGYTWQQSTIGKIEAAQRPLRLNELADLAALFGVPVTDFVTPGATPGDGDTPEAIEREIRDLVLDRIVAARTASDAQRLWYAAQSELDEAHVAEQRLDSRLRTLRMWHHRFEDIAEDALERLVERAAAGAGREIVKSRDPDLHARLGGTPEQYRDQCIYVLVKPYVDLLGEDRAERIKSLFSDAVDAAIRDRDKDQP
jgi:transcriptional regulator with XRE-family HTH domain